MNELTKIRDKLVQHNNKLKECLDNNKTISQQYNEILIDLTKDMTDAKNRINTYNQEMLKLVEVKKKLRTELGNCNADRTCEDAKRLEIERAVTEGNKVITAIATANERFNYNQNKLARLKLVYGQIVDQGNEYREQHTILQKTMNDTNDLLKVIGTMTSSGPVDKREMADTKSKFLELEGRVRQLTDNLLTAQREKDTILKEADEKWKIKENDWKQKEAEWQSKWNDLNTQFKHMEQRVGFAHDVSENCISKSKVFSEYIKSLTAQAKAIRPDDPVAIPIAETIARLEQLQANGLKGVQVPPTQAVQTEKQVVQAQQATVADIQQTEKAIEAVTKDSNLQDIEFRRLKDDYAMLRREMDVCMEKGNPRLAELETERAALEKTLRDKHDEIKSLQEKRLQMEGELSLKRAVFDNQALEIERLRHLASDNQKLIAEVKTCTTLNKKLQTEVDQQLEISKSLEYRKQQLEKEYEDFKSQMKYCKKEEEVNKLNQEMLMIRGDLDICQRKQSVQAQHILNLEQRHKATESRSDQLQKALSMNKELEDRIVESQRRHDELLATYENMKHKKELESDELALLKRHQARFLENEQETKRLQTKIHELEAQIQLKAPDKSHWISKLEKSTKLLEKHIKETGDMAVAQIDTRFHEPHDRNWARQQIIHIITQTMVQLKSAHDIAIHNIEHDGLNVSPSQILQEVIGVMSNKCNDARDSITTLITSKSTPSGQIEALIKKQSNIEMHELEQINERVKALDGSLKAEMQEQLGKVNVKAISQAQDQLAEQLKTSSANTVNGLKFIIKGIKQTQEKIADLANSTIPVPTEDLQQLKVRHNSLLEKVERIDPSVISKPSSSSPTSSMTSSMTSSVPQAPGTSQVMPQAPMTSSMTSSMTQAPSQTSGPMQDEKKNLVIQLDNEEEDDKLISDVVRRRLENLNLSVREDALRLQNQRERMVHFRDLFSSGLSKTRRLLDANGTTKLIGTSELAEDNRNKQKMLQKRLDSLEKAMVVEAPKEKPRILEEQNDEADALKSFQRFATIHSEPYVLMVVIGMDPRLVISKVISLVFAYKNVCETVFSLQIQRFTIYQGQNQVFDTEQVASLDDAYKQSRFQTMGNTNYMMCIDFGSSQLSNVIHFRIMNWAIKDFGNSSIQTLHSDPRILGSKLYSKLKSRSFIEYFHLCVPAMEPGPAKIFNQQLLKFSSDLTELEANKKRGV
jgi:hypothetical protein